MRRAAQPRGARRADRVLRWADRVPRGDRGHLAAQHCADVHGAPDSGGDAVRHLRAPQEGRRGAAPDLHRPDRGGRRVRAAGLRRLPARPKVPGDRGDLGERLGAVYPVFGFPARAAPDHLHHQRRGEPELPAPEDHQEPGALPQRRRRDQAAVAGHPRHRRQTRPPTGQGERPATDPAHRARSAGRRRHRAGLESRPRRAGFGLPRPARGLPHLTPFLRHGHSFPPRRRSPRGAPAAQRGRTTWTPTSGGRRSTAEEISTADRFTYTDILTSSRGAWHLHADETSWRVFTPRESNDLDNGPGNGPAGPARWWLWVFLGPDTACFVMDPTRAGAVLGRQAGIDPQTGQLAGDGSRKLVISSDFYAVYTCAGKKADGLVNLYCWAHLRRH